MEYMTQREEITAVARLPEQHDNSDTANFDVPTFANFFTRNKRPRVEFDRSSTTSPAPKINENNAFRAAKTTLFESVQSLPQTLRAHIEDFNNVFQQRMPFRY